MVRDPVCGMEIEANNAFATRGTDGSAVYLCSEDCAKKFDANPQQYLKPNGSAAVSATTGVRGADAKAQRIELPVTGLDKNGAPALEKSSG